MSEPLANVLGHIYPMLHATGSADLVFTTDAELTRFLNDHARRLAETYGILVVRDVTTITLIAGQQVYDLPEDHLSTLHVAVGGNKLVAYSVDELEALDDSFETTAATAQNPVARFFEDKKGFNQIGFHPVPSAASGVGETVEIIYHRYQCEISQGIEGSLPVVDYLEIQAIGEAYARESDFKMPEVAQAAVQLASVYQAAMMHYWGSSQ